jgi:hypothetical protein
MTDWSGALASAFQQHIEISGSSGSAGSRRRNDTPSNGIRGKDPGTSSSNAVVPIDSEASPPTTRAVLRTTVTTTHSGMVPSQDKQEDEQEVSFAEPGTTHTTGTTESDHVRTSPNDLFEERAAIVEDGAGVRRSWAESFARLDIAERPPDFTEKAWRELIEDGGRFLDRWANEAARLGWTALDVFGVHPAAPSTTYDAIGLVPLIRGGDVVAIGSDRATIRTQGGTLVTYLRRPLAGAIAAWELVDANTRRHRATEEIGNE